MQSKLITRILLVALALLTVLSMAACGPDNGPEEPTKGEAPTTGDGGNVETPTNDGETPTGDVLEEGPDLPSVTFPETEYHIYLRKNGEDGVDYSLELFVGTSLGATPTAVERAVYTRMVEMEEKYQILFDVEVESTYSTRTNKIDTSSKTGTDVYDLIGDHAHYLFSYASKNQLLDLNQLPHNDFTQPWWNQDARESFATLGGRLFGMIGDMSYLSVGSAFVMFFNKDIIEDVPTLTSPYQLVYDDEWTFDTFEEYVVTTDSNMNGDNTGDILTDTFGYGTQQWRGPVQALYSTGYRGMVNKGDSWKFTVNNDTTNRAVNDMRDLLWNSGTAYLDFTGEYNDLKNAFASNRVTFFDNHLHSASIFKATDLNFGILPWPKYDDAEEFYTCVDAGTQIYGVLRNTTDANAVKVSVLLEELAFLGYRDIMPFYYETILSYQYLKDEDSIKMMEIVHDNLVFDRGFFVDGTASGCFRQAVIQTPGENKSLNQIYDSNEPGLQDGIKSWNELDEQLDKEG